MADLVVNNGSGNQLTVSATSPVSTATDTAVYDVSSFSGITLTLSASGGFVTIADNTTATSVSISSTGPQGPQGVKGDQGETGVGGGIGATTGLITVTNTDGAFTHLPATYEIGTELEDILSAILEKYNITTVSFTRYYITKTNSNGSTSTANSSSSVSLEVGQPAQVVSFDYSVGDNEKTQDNSLIFIVGTSSSTTTVHESGISDINSSHTLATPYTLSPNTLTTKYLRLSAVDTGGTGGSNTTIYASGTKSLYWKWRVRYGASTTTSINSTTEAQTFFDGMTTGYDALTSETTLNMSGTTATDTQGNYTVIAYPSSWGAISSILLGATEVLSDFTDMGDYNITNDFSATGGYSFYRSNDDAAFNDTQTITFYF
jgi:hypothetical protein